MADVGPMAPVGYVEPMVRGRVVVRPPVAVAPSEGQAQAPNRGVIKLVQPYAYAMDLGDPVEGSLVEANEMITDLRKELAASQQ